MKYDKYNGERCMDESNHGFDRTLGVWRMISNMEVRSEPRRYAFEGNTFYGRDGRRWAYYRKGNELKVRPAI